MLTMDMLTKSTKSTYTFAKVYVYQIVKSSHHIPCCMPSHFDYVQLFETLWIVACQAPLSMGIL